MYPSRYQSIRETTNPLVFGLLPAIHNAHERHYQKSDSVVLQPRANHIKHPGATKYVHMFKKKVAKGSKVVQTKYYFLLFKELGCWSVVGGDGS
jgi:hypothetical protein